MNYAQIQARAATLCKIEGWTDVSPAPDWAALVQRAWDQFAWDSECVVSSETLAAVNGTGEYSLTNTYKAVLDVQYNSVGLLRSEERIERNISPNWRTQAAATPLRWVLTGFEKITLVPPPSGTLTISVRGVTLGTALAASTDIPAIPAIFHEALALKAAFFHAEIYATGEGRTRMQLFEEMYQRYVQDAREAIVEGYTRREADQA